MTVRAITSEQKRAVVERLLAAWEHAPTLRLGQLVTAACERALSPKSDLFGVEDETLVAQLEAFVIDHDMVTAPENRS